MNLFECVRTDVQCVCDAQTDSLLVGRLNINASVTVTVSIYGNEKLR